MLVRFSFNALLLVSFVVAVPTLTVARLGDASATPAPDAARPMPSYVLPEVVVTASPAGRPDVAAAEDKDRTLDRRPS